MSSSEIEAQKKLAAAKKWEEERLAALAKDAAAKREELMALRMAAQKDASESSAHVIADSATTDTLLVAYKIYLEAKVAKGEIKPETLKQHYDKASQPKKSTFTFATHTEAVDFFQQQHAAGQRFLVLGENAAGNLSGSFMLSFNDKFIVGKFKDPKTVEALEAQWYPIMGMPKATQDPIMAAIISAMEANDDAQLMQALAPKLSPSLATPGSDLEEPESSPSPSSARR